MPIDENHPNVVRFDNKLWVSTRAREDLAAQLAAQKAWDDANARANRWALAIGIGAVSGTAATYLAASILGAPPIINLFLLPVGFAIGAVLGGLVNERLRPGRPADAALGARPAVEPMTRLPRRVVARADQHSTAAELIDLASGRRPNGGS
ncbi:MAG: hypothetical protein ABL886_12820 [Rhodoglobus sp.]